MIKSYENQFHIGLMCRLLLVSRRGYYAWKHRPPSVRELSNRSLTVEVKRVFDDKKRRPGAPRIARRLQEEGQPAGRHRIARIMRDNGWRARRRPGNTRRPPTANIPCQLRLTYWSRTLWRTSPTKNGSRTLVPLVGITYVWTDEGWLYLSVVLELYSRRVIGWAISERMTATLVRDALIMALYPKGHKWNRKMPKGVIVHSDRGSQYCSGIYQKLFRKNQLICSTCAPEGMRKKGDCYDNAAMESLNHSFKVGAVYEERFNTRSEAKHQVFEYIEVYYLCPWVQSQTTSFKTGLS